MPCFFFFFCDQAYTPLVDEKVSNAQHIGFGQKHHLGQILAQGFPRRSIRPWHKEILGSGLGSGLKGSTLTPLLLQKRKHIGEIERILCAAEEETLEHLFLD